MIVVTVNPEVNPIPPIYVNVALLVLGSALAFISTVYFNSRKNNAEKVKDIIEEKKEVESRLTSLENKLALVNAAVVPISTAFQAILIKELTHFHTPEMDALMVKIGPPNTLTEEERARLAVMLKERADNLDVDIPQSERDAAHILPAVMIRSQYEQERLGLADKLGLRLVTLSEVISVPEHAKIDVSTEGIKS